MPTKPSTASNGYCRRSSERDRKRSAIRPAPTPHVVMSQRRLIHCRIVIAEMLPNTPGEIRRWLLVSGRSSRQPALLSRVNYKSADGTKHIFFVAQKHIMFRTGNLDDPRLADGRSECRTIRALLLLHHLEQVAYCGLRSGTESWHVLFRTGHCVDSKGRNANAGVILLRPNQVLPTSRRAQLGQTARDVATDHATEIPERIQWPTCLPGGWRLGPVARNGVFEVSRFLCPSCRLV
jgi:hypothetical protein